MIYRVFITPKAQKMFENIQKDIRDKINYQIGELSNEPLKRGKALIGELSGLWSLHVPRRYRIIYRVNKEKGTLEVLVVGIRKEGNKKDIYTLTKKLIRKRLI